MRHKPFDLILVVVITCIAVGVTLAGENYPALQIISGTLIVFVLPGYAVATALLSARSLGYPERIVISFGLSLITTILCGFMLNWLPWGLEKQSWIVLLGSLTLMGSAIAWIRRSRQNGGDKTASSPGIGVNLGKGMLFGFALLIVVGAVAVSRSGALNQAFPGFTQLWMVPIESANPDAVHLGFRSEESTVTMYSLELRVGDSVVGQWLPIELKPGEKWETNITLPPRQSDMEKIEALLVRLDAPQTVYRRVLLWRDR
jgi:hypothetical protein